MSKYVQTIRGTVNFEITNEFANQLGAVLGNYIGPGKSVVVGRDLNVPSQMIKRSITSGLMSVGVDIIDFGVAPLPVIHHNCHFYNSNVMITIGKSHLRHDEVDIKIFSDHEIPLETRHAEKVPWNQIGNLRYVHDYGEEYIKAVLKHVNTDLINNKAFLIVLDNDEGTNLPFTPQILNEVNCETVLVSHRESELDSDFLIPNPKRISLVSDLTTAVGADIGVLLDNDRDRVVFTDNLGNVIRDQTMLAIFAKYALEEHPGGNIVSSVVASQSLDEIVSDGGGNLIKTSVDNVLNEIDNSNAIFGGDEPGMYVFPEFQNCYDGIFSILKILEILAKKDTTLSNLASEITEYNRTIFTTECENEKKQEVIEEFTTSFSPESHINHITTVDGVRIDLEDSAILIRPSRFEPMIRVYIESKSSENLQKLIKSVKKTIEGV